MGLIVSIDWRKDFSWNKFLNYIILPSISDSEFQCALQLYDDPIFTNGEIQLLAWREKG